MNEAAETRHRLVVAVRNVIALETTEQGVLAAAVELIHGFSEGFNWTGFYLMRDGALDVGPYLGPPTPHTHIELDAGICGAAASQKQSVVVDDVGSAPRYLACSLSTRSEIVVPLMDGDACLGELDIDSDRPAFFSDDDRIMLEEIATVVVERLKAIA